MEDTMDRRTKKFLIIGLTVIVLVGVAGCNLVWGGGSDGVGVGPTPYPTVANWQPAPTFPAVNIDPNSIPTKRPDPPEPPGIWVWKNGTKVKPTPPWGN